MPVPSAYVSQPRISIDGQPSDGLSADVVSLLVEETTEGLFHCEVAFNNYGLGSGGSDYLYFRRNQLEFGKTLAVELGAGDRARTVFSGRISALEAEYPPDGGARIVALAEDRLQDLRMTRRTRSFEDVSDEDVMNQIASEHSLTPQLSVSGPTYKVLAQVNQSDLAFLRERARAANAELWLDGTTLYAKARPERDGETVELRYGAGLIAFRVRADLAHQCSEVGVSGWDVAAKEAIEETGDSSAIGAELNGDVGGTSILEQAFAARKERVVHTIPLTSEEARSLAQARYRERARRFVTGTGLADGDPRLRVGTTVSLSGLGDLFNGRYYIARVRHSYDETNGYRTEIEVERPGLGRPRS